jgi:hypothetical protein
MTQSKSDQNFDLTIMDGMYCAIRKTFAEGTYVENVNYQLGLGQPYSKRKGREFILSGYLAWNTRIAHKGQNTTFNQATASDRKLRYLDLRFNLNVLERINPGLRSRSIVDESSIVAVRLAKRDCTLVEFSQYVGQMLKRKTLVADYTSDPPLQNYVVETLRVLTKTQMRELSWKLSRASGFHSHEKQNHERLAQRYQGQFDRLQELATK